MIKSLREWDDFVVATHLSPEGDALGSVLALTMVLRALGKRAVPFEADPVPEFYMFLPGIRDIVSSLDGIAGKTLLLLDCNEPERAGLMDMNFDRSIVIDHHVTEKGFGDVKWIDPNASATGSMIFSLIKDLGVELTKDIAVNLYAALAVDTGTFRYGNTKAGDLEDAAELVRAGADPGMIAEQIYSTWSTARFKLLMGALGTLEEHGGLAIITVTAEMFRSTGARQEDTENFSNFSRMMRDTKVSAMFREAGPGVYKVSLRSRGGYDVAAVAEGFGGGGHRNAAGYRVRGSLDEVKQKLIAAFRAMKPAR